jgi:hypothetical protein
VQSLAMGGNFKGGLMPVHLSLLAA